MHLKLIQEAVANLKLEKPYSLDALCAVLSREPLGLTSEDLKYGLQGAETTLSMWSGSLSDYQLPNEWMARFDPTAPPYALAEAILLLHKVRNLVASRSVPGAS